jgi:thioredoxin 2
MVDARQIVCPHCGGINRVPVARAADAAKCGHCHAGLFDGEPAEMGEAGFDRHVRLNDIPVLVDIWAPWCGPCRTMSPNFARAAATLEPAMRLLKLNADTAPAVSARLGVRSIPALFLLHKGAVLARTAGAMPTEAIIQWARENLPPGG